MVMGDGRRVMGDGDGDGGDGGDVMTFDEEDNEFRS